MLLLQLPQEIFIKILGYVSHGDLLNFVLVSKTAYDKASVPSLWKRVKLKEFCSEESFRKLLAIERFSKVNILEIMGKGQHVVLEFYSNPLAHIMKGKSSVPRSVLDAYFQNLKKLYLHNCQTSSDNWISIFQQIIRGVQLKELIVKDWYNCEKVPAQIIGEALSKLEVVKMIETSLNHHQLEAIFSHGATSLTLKEADFSGSQVHNVSGSLIGKFATNLEKFSIGSGGNHKCMMASREVEVFFSEIANSNKLQSLDMYKCNLRSVNESLFARAFLRMKVLRLEWAKLTREQTSALFCGIAENSRIEELAFIGNHVDHIEPSVIGKAVSKLRVINLENSWMTATYLVELFERALESNSLQHMSIGGGCFDGLTMRDLDPVILGRVIRRLRSITLRDITLTQEQCISAFLSVKQSPSFIDLQLLKVNIH